MGKYNWRTAKLWARANSIEQYAEIKETSQYLFCCKEDGWMEVCHNPAVQGESHSLCRWFTGPYTCCIVREKEGVVLLIFGRGSLSSVNIR
jgi:hypothetical protein